MNIEDLVKENQLLKQRVALLEKWLDTYDESKIIQDFLLYNGLKRVGIYGYGKNGRILYRMLKKLELEFICVIDKDGNKNKGGVNFYLPGKEPGLDVIIVSPTGLDVNLIRDELSNQSCLITSLSEILDCNNIVFL